MIRKHIYPWAATFIFLWVVSAPTMVLANTARLSDTIVTNNRDHLLFYTTITDAFTEEMTHAVKKGIPVTFSIIIRVYQARGLWPDKKIAEREETHTLKYDNLKEQYIVRRSWQGSDPLTAETFLKARDAMCKIDAVAICNMDQLEKGRQYKVEAKAELDKLNLPYYLRYVLFFMSFWDVETDWQTIRFAY